MLPKLLKADIILRMEHEAHRGDSSDHGQFHPAGPHTHAHTVDGVTHLHVHDAKRDGLVFYSLVFGLFGMQLALKSWKQRYPRSFQTFSLGALWLFPCISAVMSSGYRFIVVWLIYSIACGYVCWLAKQKPLKVTTPRLVYAFFDRIYRTASATVMWSYGTMMVFMMLPPLQLLVPRFVIDYLVLGMLFGTYFCVVTRDVTELAAETIASSLGYTKKGDDDSATKPIPRGLCALCGEDLKTAGEASAEEEGVETDDHIDPAAQAFARALGQQPGVKQAPPAMKQSSLGAKGKAGTRSKSAAATDVPKKTVRLRGSGGEILYRLECGHTFHEYCAKGWCVVGKKGMCPCCFERVDLRSIMGDTLWSTPSALWVSILDAVRYFVVWIPLLMLVVRLFLYEAGIDLTTSILLSPEQNATALGNSTNATILGNAPIAISPDDPSFSSGNVA